MVERLTKNYQVTRGSLTQKFSTSALYQDWFYNGGSDSTIFLQELINVGWIPEGMKVNSVFLKVDATNGGSVRYPPLNWMIQCYTDATFYENSPPAQIWYLTNVTPSVKFPENFNLVDELNFDICFLQIRDPIGPIVLTNGVMYTNVQIDFVRELNSPRYAYRQQQRKLKTMREIRHDLR